MLALCTPIEISYLAKAVAHLPFAGGGIKQDLSRFRVYTINP